MPDEIVNTTAEHFAMENPMVPRQAKEGSVMDALVSRQVQEVQAALIIAKKFPRDEFDSFNRIMKSCSRKGLAEEAIYTYPRGGQKITGPSIRLAEALAQAWGNIDFGIIELDQRMGASDVMAYAWDLETNTRQSRVFKVNHERKADGQVKKLTDPRDIYEMIANYGARRQRACILSVIPGDVVDAAVSQCIETMAKNFEKPLPDIIRDMILFFEKEFQVQRDLLEKYIGYNADNFTAKDVVKLRGVAKAIKDGQAKREDYFDIKLSAQAKDTIEKSTLQDEIDTMANVIDTEKDKKEVGSKGKAKNDTGDNKG